MAYTVTTDFAPHTKVQSALVDAEFNAIATWSATIPSQASFDSANSSFVAVGGTANALTLAHPSTTWTTYVGKDGYRISVHIATTNTGSATVNVDSLGVKTILRTNGDAIEAGDLTASGFYDLIYDESAGKFKVTVSAIYSHPTEGIDPGAALTGANVFSDITVNAAGHVTGSATRALTLANLGYTGETDATADQTDAEIRTAVEAATDSNVFTDADHSKLNGIEASATADQTKADIDALGIDADTIDGIDSTDLVRVSVSSTISAIHLLSSTVPGIRFEETDQGVDLKRWFLVANSGQLTVQTLDDANGFLTSALSLSRSGDFRVDGDFRADNDQGLQIKDFGGTYVSAVKLDAGDNLTIGDATGVDNLFIQSSLDQVHQVAGAEKFRVRSTGTKTTGIHEVTGDLQLTTNNSSIEIDDSVGSATNMLTFDASDNMVFGDSTKVDSMSFDVASGAASDGIRFLKGGSLGVHIGENSGDTTFGGQTAIATNENTNEGVHIRGIDGQINSASDAATTPNIYLSKIGAIDAPYIVFNRNALEVGSIDYSGGVTRYNTTSDYRLKENDITLDNGLDRVNALQPKRFNYKTHPDVTVDGFLAHEVQDVVPEAVSGEKDGEDMQLLDASKLIPILTKAIQELSARVAQLEDDRK